MQFKCSIVGGKIIFPKGFDEFVKKQKDGRFTFKIEKSIDERTKQQNDSLHLWCKQISDVCRENGITIDKILVDLQFTPYYVKESIIKKTLESISGKKSTTKMTTQELNDIIDIVTQAFAIKTSGMIQIPPFPSMKNQ